jgi:hypothetical protein
MFLWDVLKSFYTIMRAHGFLHRAYAKRYLGNEQLFPLALLHYVLIGERRGFRPNAFFDPFYFHAASSSISFSDYILDMRLWIFSPSREFDVDWYIDRYGQEIETSENPLLHFLNIGFAKLDDPAPHISGAFLWRCLARDSDRKHELIYDLFTGSAPVALNIQDLEQAQARFKSAIELNTIKTQAAPAKPNLLFVQAGHDYRPAFSHARRFDVLVNYFEGGFSVPADAEYIFQQKGTKATAIEKLLTFHRDLLLGYEAVLFLDDDVVISEQQIDRLFELRATHGLDLLQPCLSARSSCFFPYIKQPLAGAGLRQFTAVEIMMPVVSRRVLEVLGGTFGECISGWGVDLLLSQRVRDTFGETIGLAADIQCEHLRPTDPAGGAFYTFLASNGIVPAAEMGRLVMLYGINDKINAIRPVSETDQR